MCSGTQAICPPQVSGQPRRIVNVQGSFVELAIAKEKHLV
jgi:hypothetical protein